jgi:hypothetical protein
MIKRDDGVLDKVELPLAQVPINSRSAPQETGAPGMPDAHRLESSNGCLANLN